MSSLNQFKELVETLKEKQLTISVAESYTGGLFSANMTEISGASKVFKGSIVAYDTAVKINQLGIGEDLVDTFGVVSSWCAIAMAKNVAELLDTDIGLSFTGVAGPDPQEDKPVGTCFIGVYYKKSYCFLPVFEKTDRSSIRQESLEQAINWIKEVIK